MHHRRKHPTGKPQLRHRTSEWTYPYAERGSYNHAKYSVSKEITKYRHRLKEYYNGLSSNG